MTAPRRAVRNDSAAHPTLATLFVFAALASMTAAFGSAYEEPWLLTWVLGGGAVVFAALFVWALLPDGGPRPEDCLSAGVPCRIACDPPCTEPIDEDDDDVRADARQHADEDDPFGVIGGAP